MDVDRSFTHIMRTSMTRTDSHSKVMTEKDLWRFQSEFFEINHYSLLHVLNTFAYHNHNIGYCQGMNFLAGFFLLFFKSEETAFHAMNAVVNKFELEGILNLKLQPNFYVMDKLIAIYLPDLHSHFSAETISSSLFSSPWFITLFTNS
jgi:hypothetical protein